MSAKGISIARGIASAAFSARIIAPSTILSTLKTTKILGSGKFLTSNTTDRPGLPGRTAANYLLPVKDHHYQILFILNILSILYH